MFIRLNLRHDCRHTVHPFTIPGRMYIYRRAKGDASSQGGAHAAKRLGVPIMTRLA